LKYDVFLDYDNMLFDEVLDDVLKLQKKYKFKKFEIYLSSRKQVVSDLYIYSYHVVIYGDFQLETVRKIVSQSKADIRFRKLSKVFPFSVLRIGEKKFFKPELLFIGNLRCPILLYPSTVPLLHYRQSQLQS